MNTEIRMELTRNLERLKLSSEGANARWLFAAGIIAELLGGAALIEGAIRLSISAVTEGYSLLWAEFMFLLLGILLLAHAGTLAFKRSMNRKLRALYEAILESTAAHEG